MPERNEKLQPKTCWWCSGNNDPYKLNIGAGMFRDFDSDLSYGIPVCGGCGGLGVQYEDEDFKKRTQRIMDLRFEYCPTDGENQESMTLSKRLEALEALDSEVKDLVNTYGEGVEGSFAQRISKGALDGKLESLKGRIEFIETLRNTPPTGDSAKDALKPATTAFFEGKLAEADNIFRKVIEEFPNSSLPQHDYAVFVIESEGNYEKALLHLIRSTELEPKRALHFFQVGKCLIALLRLEEALPWIEKAKALADPGQLEEETGENPEEITLKLKELIRSENYSLN